MSQSILHRSIIRSVEQYKLFLENVSEEDFQLSPAEGVWSYSEVYAHIFNANLASLVAAERCLNGTGEKTTTSIHWMAWLILFFGRFPPGRYKAPASIAAMAKKITKEEARNLIYKFNARLEEVAPGVLTASPFIKIKHPRLGLLTSPQWLTFINVHTRHHERQLRRISKMLQRTR